MQTSRDRLGSERGNPVSMVATPISRDLQSKSSRARNRNAAPSCFYLLHVDSSLSLSERSL